MQRLTIRSSSTSFLSSPEVYRKTVSYFLNRYLYAISPQPSLFCKMPVPRKNAFYDRSLRTSSNQRISIIVRYIRRLSNHKPISCLTPPLKPTGTSVIAFLENGSSESLRRFTTAWRKSERLWTFLAAFIANH